jgi:hypothetical protein
MIVDEERCAACGHVARTYARRMPKGDLRALFCLRQLHRDGGPDWVHVNELPTSKGGDFAKWEHWGFIKHRPNTDPSKKDSGFWQLTYNGNEFLCNRLAFPLRVHLRSGFVVGWGEEICGVKQLCEGAGFDYEELMS